MTRIALLAPAALALAGCATPFGPRPPFSYDRKGDLVEYNYAWSSEVSASPALVRRLRSDLETAWNAASTAAQADRAAALAGNFPFRGHMFDRRWTTAGQTPRLLSLEGQTSTYTGGAHPNHGVDALLWDRRGHAEIRFERLFTTAGDLDRLVRTPFCRTLDGERARRRAGAPSAGSPFTDCPKLPELAVIPADSNANRRFDRLRLIAAHGVAGPYAEGRYDIAVPVTAELRAAIKPAWRASFEVQPQ